MGVVPEDVELSGLELFLLLPYVKVIDHLWGEVLDRWYRALIEETNNDPWNVEKHGYFTQNRDSGDCRGVVNQRLDKWCHIYGLWNWKKRIL